MATHELSLSISPPIQVGNVDIEITVHSDGAKLGTLQVSRGSIDWTPARHRRGYGLSWEEFAKLIAKHGYRERA